MNFSCKQIVWTLNILSTLPFGYKYIYSWACQIYLSFIALAILENRFWIMRWEGNWDLLFFFHSPHAMVLKQREQRISGKEPLLKPRKVVQVNISFQTSSHDNTSPWKKIHSYKSNLFCISFCFHFGAWYLSYNNKSIY